MDVVPLPFMSHRPEIPLEAINQGAGIVIVSSMRLNTRHHRMNYFRGASLVEILFGFLALKQQYHDPVDLGTCEQISDLVRFPTVPRHILVSSPFCLKKPAILGGFVAHSPRTNGIAVSKLLSVIPAPQGNPCSRSAPMPVCSLRKRSLQLLGTSLAGAMPFATVCDGANVLINAASSALRPPAATHGPRRRRHNRCQILTEARALASCPPAYSDARAQAGSTIGYRRPIVAESLVAFLTGMGRISVPSRSGNLCGEMHLARR
jgi:hypothetical protein